MNRAKSKFCTAAGFDTEDHYDFYPQQLIATAAVLACKVTVPC